MEEGIFLSIVAVPSPPTKGVLETAFSIRRLRIEVEATSPSRGSEMQEALLMLQVDLGRFRDNDDRGKS